MKDKIITRPTTPEQISFDHLYDEIRQDWPAKAARLQARRWQQIRLKEPRLTKNQLMNRRISRTK